MAKAKKATTQKPTKSAAAPKAAGRCGPARVSRSRKAASPSAPPPESATQDELDAFLDGFDPDADLKLHSSGQSSDPASTTAKKSRARTAGSMTAEQYEQHKQRSANRQRAQTAAGQDIGPMPHCEDHERRERCRLDLKQFCLDYLPDSFNLGFSRDHEIAIAKMQSAILHGEKFALAMPRGSGKTTLTIAAVLWALLYGYRHYVLLIGATKPLALKLLKVLKTRLQYSEHLVADFPEICLPCQMLGNQANKAGGQKSSGAPTHIVWEKETICLPIVADSEGVIQPSAGAVVECTGITGAVRGRQQPMPSGEIRRPDMAVIDDPQTKRSAKSASQVADRLEIIDQDVLGLPGPKDTFAAFVLCTVIRPDDVADQLLNQDEHPEWQGERIRAVRRMPDNMALWQECWEVECEGMRSGRKQAGNEFYKAHRAELDAGCEVYWEDRYDTSRVSAIQHWMYFFLRSVDAFNAEAQQEPTPPIDSVDLRVSEDELILKQHSTAWERAPVTANLVTAMIDVQERLLFWVVTAWQKEAGNGFVLAYGTWPEQKLRHFRYTDKGLVSLQMRYPGRGLEAAMKIGLRECLQFLSKKRYTREDSATLEIGRILVDGGDMTEHVKEAVATSGVSIAHVSFGRYYGASATPLGARKPQPGVVRGDNWQSRYERDRKVHAITFDSNHWKGWIDARLDTSIDDVGSLSLPKQRPESHTTFARHCRAETRTLVYAPETGRRVWEYKLPPDKPDNHWWDGLIGNAVAASQLGVKVPDGAAAMADQIQRLSVAERQRQRLMNRTIGGDGAALMDPQPTAASPVSATTAAPKKLSMAERQRQRLAAQQ